jgi:peptidoglycan-associated lipoprotein
MIWRTWKSLSITALILAFWGTVSFAQNDKMAEHRFLFEYIYFKADSAAIQPSFIEILDRKVEWLKQNPGVSVIIEGHCDERGSAAFNMQLGEARSGRVKTYLIQKGIASARLLTISYGKEEPVDTGHSEEALAKNRRVRFVIAP